jgi:type II secretory pathway pseudopilin PulG
MAELLVVIGIITVLAGILLVAMKGVRARALATQTESTMQSLMAACDTFQTETGRYPGVIPEEALAEAGSSDPPPLSSTENALLDLAGGYRAFHPQLAPDLSGEYANFSGSDVITISVGTTGWEIKVDRNAIFEGPLINGTPHAPFLTPGTGESVVANGQMNDSGVLESCATQSDNCLPDLVDAWGQPLIYLRKARPSGDLVLPWSGSGAKPQFYLEPITPYTTSTRLGEAGKNQTSAGNAFDHSLLDESVDRYGNLAAIIAHPALEATARGAYAVFSAGPDGIYYSRSDGPGGTGIGPTIADEYDDIRRFGGG